ncbi:MAG: hypothetical protein HYY24_07780 [Verrucomicrobia bacterium]|nr:hypothetical protein [Verrucomicrobiota bacterium]
MTIEKIRELYEVEPFHPFIMHLADGREIPVIHREFLASAPSGRTVIVFQPDDSFNIVDLLLVTDLEVRSKNGAKTKKR